MTTSSDLYYLIKSLSKNEKIYFSKYADVHVKNKSNNYKILFNIINSLDTYDENKVNEKLKENRIELNLSIAKTQLLNLILKILRIYHEEKSLEFQLSNLLLEIEILFSKSLYSHALKLVKKGKKLSFKIENYTFLIHFCKWEMRLSFWLQKSPKIIEEQITNSKQLRSKGLEKLNQTINLEDQYNNLYLQYIKFGKTFPKEELILSPRPQNIENNFIGEIIFHNINSLHSFITNNYKKEEFHLMKIIRKLENAPKMINCYPRQYSFSLINLAELYLVNKKKEKVLESIKKISKLSAKYEIFNSPEFISIHRTFSILFELGLSIITPFDVKAFSKTYNKFLNEPTPPKNFNSRVNLEIHLYIAIGFFHKKDYFNAKHWLSKITSSNYHYHSKEFISFTKLFSLVIYILLYEIDIFESQYRSFKRYFSNLNTSNNFELFLITQLKLIFYSEDYNKKIETIEETQKTLRKYTSISFPFPFLIEPIEYLEHIKQMNY